MEINLVKVMEFIIPLLTIIVGALSAYLKADEKIRSVSIEYIVEAEKMYKDAHKAGGQKFSWVVNTLYKLVPSPLRFLVTKSFVEKVVQSTFDGIEEYAKTQLDKAVDNYIDNGEDENTDKNLSTDDNIS